MVYHCHNCHNSLFEFVISAFEHINAWENSPKLDVGICYILCELFTNIDPIYSSHNSHNSHNSQMPEWQILFFLMHALTQKLHALTRKLHTCKLQLHACILHLCALTIKLLTHQDDTSTTTYIKISTTQWPLS